MSKLTSLEKDVLRVIFSSILPEREYADSIVEAITVKDRTFSSVIAGACSGFYTHFESNTALACLNEVPSEFSIQAKCNKLSFGEMGFFVFCDASTQSLTVMEGFFYGDDRLSVDEFLKNEHIFSVYVLPGL